MRSRITLGGALSIVVVVLVGCGQPTQADINKYFSSIEPANVLMSNSITQFVNDMNSAGLQQQITDLSDMQKSLNNLKAINVPNILDLKNWNDKMMTAFGNTVSDASNEVKTQNDASGGMPAMSALQDDIQSIQSLLEQEPQLKAKYAK